MNLKLSEKLEIRSSASGASLGVFIEGELHRPLNDLEEHMAKLIERQRQVLTEAGICPDCLQVPHHHLEEPFATCACGTGEDYARRPMQRLQKLEGLEDALPTAEEIQTIEDLVSLGGTYAEEAAVNGPRSWHPFTADKMRDLAWGGYARAFEVIKRLKGVTK